MSTALDLDQTTPVYVKVSEVYNALLDRCPEIEPRILMGILYDLKWYVENDDEE